jgi:hypothetical protein
MKIERGGIIACPPKKDAECVFYAAVGKKEVNGKQVQVYTWLSGDGLRRRVLLLDHEGSDAVFIVVQQAAESPTRTVIETIEQVCTVQGE